MAGIVEQQPCQQVVGLAAYDGAVGPLGKCLADQSNAVRIPAAPPLTLMLPVFLSALPSNENTSIDLSAIDWASSVLPSLLQATPCPQAPNSAFAASVSLVPLIRKIESALPL